MQKEINGYNGDYKIDDDGNVYSYKCAKGFDAAYKMRTPIDSIGYKVIRLSNRGRVKTHLVHQLVMKYFGPVKPSKKHEINHIDGNKSNSNIGNLEWVTPSENKCHAYDNGLFKKDGINHKRTPKIIIRQIRLYYSNGKNIAEIARLFNMNYITVYNIAHKKRHKSI